MDIFREKEVRNKVGRVLGVEQELQEKTWTKREAGAVVQVRNDLVVVGQ